MTTTISTPVAKLSVKKTKTGYTVEIPRNVIPVGKAELVELLHCTRDTVDKWSTRGLLPDPDWTVGGRPAWNLATIAKWCRDTDRIDGYLVNWPT